MTMEMRNQGKCDNVVATMISDMGIFKQITDCIR